MTHSHVTASDGTVLHVVDRGEGDAVVLLHGFPHTWRLWERVLPALAVEHRVLVPDLRGLGASGRAASGYDPRTLADDVCRILDAAGVAQAAVVGIDAGAAPALMMGLEHPDRTSRLVLMEALLGTLPGAEDFLRGGPPWWFGFHMVPGLAERVLEGHEAEYLDFFLRAGTHDRRGVDPAIRDAFVDAYRGRESLRCAFEHYRAMPEGARQIAHAVDHARLDLPVLAIGGDTVGDATALQLRSIASDLSSHVVPESGHLIPLDRPDELLRILMPFVSDASASAPREARGPERSAAGQHP